MSAKGRPTQYLGHCQYFKDQNLAKQKELLKSHKICYQCLAPMKDCRKPEDLKICSKQIAWNLKCKHCNDTRHHSLICPSKPSQTYKAEHQNDGHSNGGRGGGRGGRGGNEEAEEVDNEEKEEDNYQTIKCLTFSESQAQAK